MPKRKPLAERFWDKVDQRGPDECWEWQAFRLPGGYGKIAADRVRGEPKVSLTAHRVAWEFTNGRPVPDGMRVCHRCDNPPCCNPAHLFLGTAKENTRDMLSKARHCHGERYPHHKLTEDDVREIRKLKAAGVTYDELERRFGVTRAPLHRIVTRRSWGHVA